MTSACALPGPFGSHVPVPGPPEWLSPPAAEVARPALEESPPMRLALVPPPPGGPVDEILGSRAGLDDGLRERVAWWIDYWRGEGAGWFAAYLERMATYGEPVDAALAARGLPPSLLYLPIVESGYNPVAVSRARAVGLWQLMGPTARDLGLEVGPLVDERRDPVRSTAVALAFLTALRDRFGSWYLALAAYNGGPARVQRVVHRHAPLAPRHDSLYWRLRAHLPAETRDFVPKFLAAVTLASNPTAHGFEPADDAGVRFDFDEVGVPDATTLDVVALAAETTEQEIHRLNPQILRGITPPGRRVSLRVPRGAGPRFHANYPRIPPGDRVTFVEHRVVAGETLSHIAERYRLPLHELRAANPDVRDRFLQIGQPLTVPVGPGAARPAPSGG